MLRSSVVRSHDPPPSSDRNRPPFSALLIGETLEQSDGAIATPILPHIPGGRPFFFESFLSDVQVSPPSRETKRSEPGPPPVRTHGLRRTCQNPAKTTRGLFGSISTSEQPVS